MKTLFLRWQLILAVVALILAGVLPLQAVRLSKGQVYRTAVFQTTSTTRIAVGANTSASLLNLGVGDHVSIAYDQENGLLVAHHISDGVPPRPRNPGVNPVSHHPSTASIFAHLRGFVRSVNAQAGTLTVEYRLK
jgi:hypothetical protein